MYKLLIKRLLFTIFSLLIIYSISGIGINDLQAFSSKEKKEFKKKYPLIRDNVISNLESALKSFEITLPETERILNEHHIYFSRPIDLITLNNIIKIINDNKLEFTNKEQFTEFISLDANVLGLTNEIITLFPEAKKSPISFILFLQKTATQLELTSPHSLLQFKNNYPDASLNDILELIDFVSKNKLNTLPKSTSELDFSFWSKQLNKLFLKNNSFKKIKALITEAHNE
ncbi:MAG: hypothetical protein HQK51_19380, partial [Oligoflexia bacterium]|nr:hypothetical protein [Oligoflexia bacterium]